jgi:hypothetical protein
MRSSTLNSPAHEWTINFSCLIYVDKLFLINDFVVTVGFRPIIENPILNDITLDKIEMFFKTLMNGSIILDTSEYDETISGLTSNNFVMTPGKANDQVIGCLLLYKLISLVDKDLEISHIVISSSLGNNIRFTFDTDSLELAVLVPSREEWWEDPETKIDPWWLRSDSATYDLLKEDGDYYKGDLDWDELFREELQESENFNKETKKIFKIIPGGKDAD